MAFYRVNNNAQSNGDHEVHKQGCSHSNEGKVAEADAMGAGNGETRATIEMTHMCKSDRGCFHGKNSSIAKCSVEEMGARYLLGRKKY